MVIGYFIIKFKCQSSRKKTFLFLLSEIINIIILNIFLKKDLLDKCFVLTYFSIVFCFVFRKIRQNAKAENAWKEKPKIVKPENIELQEKVMAQETVSHSGYVPAQLERHLEFMNFNTGKKEFRFCVKSQCLF